ncbi:ATP-binding protein [Leptolyngbyaceae cyanobacterium UHCC 1019]
MGSAGMERGDSQWADLNYRYLMIAIEQVIACLKSEQVPDPEPLNPPAAIEQLCHLFELSQFERAIVLLGAAVELHGGLAALLPAIAGGPSVARPTFSLATQYLPQMHWSAFTPESPLRRWQLIELGSASTLIYSPFRINERILHFLMGNAPLDTQLLGMVTRLPTDHLLRLPPSQQQLVTEIVTLLQQASTPSIVQICGYDSATKQAIASAVCAQLGIGLLSLAANILPTDFTQLSLLQTLWEREALLGNSLLLLDCDGVADMHEGTSAASSPLNAIAYLLESCHGSMLVFSRDRRSVRKRAVFSFEVASLTALEQRQLWRQQLAEELEKGAIEPVIEKLVSHFNLSPLSIQTICAQSRSNSNHSNGTDSLPKRLWSACLSHSRPQIEELAQPIRTQASWEDLVLPDKEAQTLRTVIAQVRQRAKVYEEWGFAKTGERGLGISALFSGASGTGKTLAAEVLAHELQLDLYRVDLSSVVSKYIGETEKNLRRIFDAAEIGGAILLFDEADALFGKRSEVKDSHDRYANMEVAYLLQRMESYRGLAILTTNLKNSLDQAFLRRLRFVVQFPFPDAAQRAEIWQRVFPKSAPTAGLSFHKLAKLTIPGGNIRNIALNAAFLAAEANLPVQMSHILQAAQSEYIKLERPLTEAETKAWS